jgi:hypothetical protein
MATERYNKTIELLSYCLKENVTLKQACEHFELGEGFPRRSRTRLAEALVAGRITNAEFEKFTKLYNQVTTRKAPAAASKPTPTKATLANAVDLDTDERFDERSKGWEVRDDKGQILSYAYKIMVRDELPFTGSLTRDQMEKIYSEYPYNTLNNVSVDFPYLTVQDLKRIMRTFNITKDRLFPPHIVEEHTEEEIANFALKAKEKSSAKKFTAQKLPFIEGKLRDAQDELRKARASQEWAEKLLEKYINTRTVKPVAIKPKNAQTISEFNFLDLRDNGLSGTTIAAFSDIHMGKKFPTSKAMFGRGTTKAILRERLLRLAKLTTEEANYKKSAKLALVCTGDIFESIQPAGQRIQHSDSMDIMGDEQFMFALEVFEEMFDHVVNEFKGEKIVFHGIGGNHDRLMDSSSFDKKRTAAQLFYKVLNRVLSLKYNNAVEIKTYEDGIIAFSEGKVSYVGHHGDASLAKRNPLEIMNLFKVGDSKNYTVLLKGHLHNFKADWEYPNCMSIQLRSICSTDEFGQNELGKGAQPGFTIITESEGYGVDFKTFTLA